jgi:hypothetical protein
MKTKTNKFDLFAKTPKWNWLGRYESKAEADDMAAELRGIGRETKVVEVR